MNRAAFSLQQQRMDEHAPIKPITTHQAGRSARSDGAIKFEA